MTNLLALFALLTLADIWTTSQFPKYGIREANPLLAPLMDRYGIKALYAAKALVFAIIAGLTLYGLLAWQVLAGLCALMGAVVAWNLYQIYRRLHNA